ncbi:hypothetical protein ANN_14425 [Periplaneta americana]|uniref:Uncharacterized protein n=1 Tax=Periplaneta americana TaxID=6978 RepID=A0ABQ8SYF3_PERAM|nr:hypothetical protein ANN_14425 [Periplaneta americana]
MAGLCEGGNEPAGSLKAICLVLLRVQFKVCHGSLYAIMWLVVEPREFNLPTLPQRRITYVPEKLPSKYGVHSEEQWPYVMLTKESPVSEEKERNGSKNGYHNMVVSVAKL